MKKEYVIIGAVVLTIGYFVWRNNPKKGGIGLMGDIDNMTPITESQYYDKGINEYVLIKPFTTKKCVEWGSGDWDYGCHKWQDDYTYPIGSIVKVAVRDWSCQGVNCVGKGTPTFIIDKENLSIPIEYLGKAKENSTKQNDATKNGFPFALDLTKLQPTLSRTGVISGYKYDIKNWGGGWWNVFDNTIAIGKDVNTKKIGEIESGTHLTGIYNVKDGSLVSFKKEDYVYDPNDPKWTTNEQMYWCQDKNGNPVIQYSPCENGEYEGAYIDN